MLILSPRQLFGFYDFCNNFLSFFNMFYFVCFVHKNYKGQNKKYIYGRNQSGCENAKNVGFLTIILWVFLTIYIFDALMEITMCLKQLEVSHIMAWDS